jgi:hypothetical protein
LVDLHYSYQLERSAVASDGNILMEKIVALTVEQTATVTRGVRVAQAASVFQEGQQELAERVFLLYSALAVETWQVASHLRLGSAHLISTVWLETLGSLEQSFHFGNLVGRWALMAESLALDVVDYHKAARENLFVAVARERYGPGREATAAVVGVAAVAEVDAPEPCSVEPIPSSHLASCLRPFLQIP